jgi:hypothetical protein
MSNHPHSHDDDVPRFEPWLGVMASSVVPVIVGLYVHSRYLVPLIVATVALFLFSLVMLRRQTVRRRLERRERPLPGARSSGGSVDGEAIEMQGAEP